MKMQRGRAMVAVVAAFATSGLAACSSSGSDASSAGGGGDEYKVAFVTGQINDPFYVLMQQGAEEKADELGVDLDYQGATVWDPSQQIPIFDSVRATGPDFLIAVPVEQTALLGAVQAYTGDDIPVMTVDTDLAEKSARLVNISSDNLAGGELAAKTLAEKLDGKGKVTILCYQPGITVNDERLRGFESEIAKHEDIEYVGPQLMQGADPTESTRYFNAVMQKHPDLTGVATCANVASAGVVSAMKEKGLVGKVTLVGFDIDQDLLAGVKDGSISALIVQQTAKMGADAVQWAYDYLAGNEPPEEDVRLDFSVIDETNADTPETEELVGD